MKKVGINIGLAAVVIIALLVIRMSNIEQGRSDVEVLDETVASQGAAGTAAVRDGHHAGGDRIDDDKSVKSEQSVDDTKEPELSDAVETLLGLDGKEHNYPSLLVAIHELNKELSADDVAALLEMLTYSNDRFPEGMRPIEINAVKNDVLDMLLRQKTLPKGIGLQMADMAGNTENDPVWRDYCVQFMGPFYERASEERGGTTSVSSLDGTEPVPPNELEIIQNAMFQALDERTSTIAGTALIGLENLSRSRDEFDREEITTKAVEIASDELASTTSRMTALRLASDLVTKDGGSGSVPTRDDTEIIPSVEGVAGAARSLAQTGDTVLMRSAAMVTLGELGSESDRELLESYLLDSDRQIAAAAQQALDKMDERENAPEIQEEQKLADTTPKPVVKEKPILINQL